MEIRYELALKQFYDKMKAKMEEHITREELDERMYEKLHKREFEKHFERLNSTCSTLDTMVANAIPAMKYDLQTGLKGKAEQRDLDFMKEDKAGKDFVLRLVKRLNKLEEDMAFKGKTRVGSGGRASSASGSRSRSDERSRSVSHISEDEDEDESGDESSPRKKKQSVTEKALKGSSSMEQIKKKEEKGGLASIDEDAEQSIKSQDSPVKSPGKAEDIASKGSVSPAGNIRPSGGVNLGNLSQSAGGEVAGGAVDNAFKETVNRKLEE